MNSAILAPKLFTVMAKRNELAPGVFAIQVLAVTYCY